MYFLPDEFLCGHSFPKSTQYSSSGFHILLLLDSNRIMVEEQCTNEEQLVKAFYSAF